MTAEKRKDVLLRMPPALYAELKARADEQDVSVNHLLIALLAGAISFNLKRKK